MNNTEKEMKLYHVRRKLEGLAYFASVCAFCGFRRTKMR